MDCEMPQQTAEERSAGDCWRRMSHRSSFSANDSPRSEKGCAKANRTGRMGTPDSWRNQRYQPWDRPPTLAPTAL